MNASQRFFSLAVFSAFLNPSYLFTVQTKRLSTPQSSVKAHVGAARSSLNSSKNYATMPVKELYELALSYRKGDKGVQDDKRAFELFQIGAHRHHAPAEFQLGSCYDFGRGVAPDPIKAFEYYQRAAKQDYTLAQTSLGVCYASGAGVSVDRPKALKLYHIVAKKKKGNCVALFNLGACYEEGNGVKVDLKKAFEFYKRAAEQEDADAEYEVGLCYEQGKGIKVNGTEARKYFKRAASHGHEEAQKKLALDRTKSNGASAPIQKSQSSFAKIQNSSSQTQPIAITSKKSVPNSVSLRLLPMGSALDPEANNTLDTTFCKTVPSRAQKTGGIWISNIPDAPDCIINMSSLPEMYQQAYGATQENTAAPCTRERIIPDSAHCHNYSSSSYPVCPCGATMSRNANGSEVWNTAIASQSSRLSAEDLYQLALQHRTGKGAVKDDTIAIALFKDAAERGHVAAIHEVGRCLYLGVGVDVDETRALKWFRLAAQKGYKEPQEKDAKKLSKALVGPECQQSASSSSSAASGSLKQDQRNAQPNEATMSASELFDLGEKYRLGNGVAKDEKRAFECYDKAAKLKHSAALHQMGRCYYFGELGITIDCVKAFECFQCAAQQGYAKSQNNLGICYEYGRGTQIDLKRAFELYQLAANQGLPEAQFNLGYRQACGATMSRDVNGSEIRTTINSKSSNFSAEDLYQLTLKQRTGEGAPKDAKKLSKASAGPECQQPTSSSSSAVSGSLKQDQRNAQPNEATMSASELFDLGEKYRLGNGVAKDEKRAFELCKQSADKGYAQAQYNLAICYEYGKGVAANLVKAFELHQLAAKQEHGEARCNLGLCYQYGIGVAIDKAKAVELYQLAADQGNPQAQYHLAGCYEYGRGVAANLAKAFEYYQLAAKQEYAEAQCNLGVYYEYGKGVVANKAKAFELYQLAANQGCLQAQCNLGICYEYGNGVAINRAEALKFYELALKRGHAEAQQKLDGLLLNVDVRRDCANLTAERLFELGQRYRTSNTRLAYELFQLATEKGYAPAENSLGVCYEYGQGIYMCRATAVELYRSAAKKGWSKAQYNLARCYFAGIGGVTVDKREAVGWYERSARQGFAEAQYRLGLCYENGWGTDVNQEKAAEWYELAARQDHPEARSNLTRIAPMRAAFADELKPLSNGDLTSIPSSSSSSSQASMPEVDSKNDGQGQKETKEAAAECARTSASSTLSSSSSSSSSSATKSSSQNVTVTDVTDEEDDDAQEVHERSRTDSTHSSSSSSSASLGSSSSSAAALGVSNSENSSEREKESKMTVAAQAFASSSSSSSSSSSDSQTSPGEDVSGLRYAKVRAALQALEQVPHPRVDRTPLDEALQKSILADCPERIHAIIAQWSEKNKGADYYKTLAKAWLLLGPAGTGKSSLGKAIAKRCDIPFNMYFCSSIANSYKDSGSPNLDKIFSDAAAVGGPCVIIFDEFEVLFKRHANKADAEAGMLTNFWTLVDEYRNYPILIIATANDVSKAPSQIKSRFVDNTIKVPLPNEQQREKIIGYHMGCIFGVVDVKVAKDLAKKTEGLPPRRLEALIRNAKEKEKLREARAREAQAQQAREQAEAQAREQAQARGIPGQAQVVPAVVQAPQVPELSAEARADLFQAHSDREVAEHYYDRGAAERRLGRYNDRSWWDKWGSAITWAGGIGIGAYMTHKYYKKNVDFQKGVLQIQAIMSGHTIKWH